ncbi:DNA-3-methyladenine glycosylase family protein [Streptomyces sp. NPDC087420]|uniref:DNA-3-methyladenine glycosylase family protein n=1 Tax=Streptomyces sp. NPDC087420 TaxID=3365785 RepID=UPI003836F5C2
MSTRPTTATGDPYGELARLDPVLARLTASYGRPDPFRWDDGGRTEGDRFAALVLHIAGQQISTAVAFVLFDRIRAAIGALPDPAGIVALGPERLRACGLSHAKASYLLALSESRLGGLIDVDGLDGLTDAEAVAALTAVRGLGRWTAEMFLLHQLRRSDVLPVGDVGIRRAVERGWGLDTLPTPRDVEGRTAAWSPYRSYASALLWASLRPPETPAAPAR